MAKQVDKLDQNFAFTSDADLDAQIQAFKQAHEAATGQRLAVDSKRSLGPGKVRMSIWKLNADCAGSGAMISRYWRPPSDASALRVPIPGCDPPMAARTPVVFSNHTIAASRSGAPSSR